MTDTGVVASRGEKIGDKGLVGLKVIHSEPGIGASQLGCLSDEERGCEAKMSSSVAATRPTEPSGQLLDLVCVPRSEATVRSFGRTGFGDTLNSGKPPKVAISPDCQCVKTLEMSWSGLAYETLRARLRQPRARS